MDLYDELEKYIDLPFLITVICIGYALSGALANLIERVFHVTKDGKVYSVFLIATILAIPFKYLFGVPNLKLMVTYGVATSMYEVVVKQVIAIIGGLTVRPKAGGGDGQET